MRDLFCELDKYKAKNGKVYDYIKYQYINTETKTCEEFSNMECFIIDTKCPAFIDIMSKTGGFVANMTTRLFKEENLNVAYMMLVVLPQSTCNFLFDFLYLDEDKNVLKKLVDNNYSDFSYFKKKFEPCITDRGSVYDLDFNFLKEQISDTVSADFDLIIENRPITKEDIIIVNKNDINLADYEIESLTKCGIDISHYEFKLDFGGLSFIHLNGVAVTTSGDIVKDYQLDDKYTDKGILTDDAYIEYTRNKMKEFYGRDVDCKIPIEPYTFIISLDSVKKISNSLSYKSSRENFINKQDIEEIER